MHQIVLFIEPNEHEYETPFKIGNKFMNLCAIDEDAGFEIVKVLKLGKILKKVLVYQDEDEMSPEERHKKGIALIIVTGNRHSVE